MNNEIIDLALKSGAVFVYGCEHALLNDEAIIKFARMMSERIALLCEQSVYPDGNDMADTIRNWISAELDASHISCSPRG